MPMSKDKEIKALRVFSRLEAKLVCVSATVTIFTSALAEFTPVHAATLALEAPELLGNRGRTLRNAE